MTSLLGDFAYTAFRSPQTDTTEEAAWPPTIFEFMCALSLWTACQRNSPTVKEAAKVFRTPEVLVAEAVTDEDSWMYLGSISNDGTPFVHNDGA